MAILMLGITSSNIEAIGYDASSRTLAVKFREGGTYHYNGVPPEVFKQFHGAQSKGGFFSAHIKERYKFKKQ